VVDPKDNDPRLLLLSDDDSVFVLRDQIEAGESICVEGRRVMILHRLGLGEKIARKPVGIGEKVFKYNAPIGSATAPIEIGDHVHLHNLKSDYTATHALNKGDGI